MKKILGLSVALIAVIAMLGTGTWAYFNDVQTSANNTITAGTLTLAVGGTGTGHFTIDGTDSAGIIPGDHAVAGKYILHNTGSLAGDMYVTSANVNDTNGLSSKMKIAVVLSTLDTTGTALGTYSASSTYYYFDTNTKTFINTDTANGSNDSSLPDAAYAIADTTLGDLISVNGISLPAGAGGIAGGNFAGTLYVLYNFPDTPTGGFFASNTDNAAQGLQVKFDLKFALVQHGQAP